MIVSGHTEHNHKDKHSEHRTVVKNTNFLPAWTFSGLTIKFWILSNLKRCLLVCFFFWHKFSCRSGSPQTCYVAKDHELLVLLCRPTKCWVIGRHHNDQFLQDWGSSPGLCDAKSTRHQLSYIIYPETGSFTGDKSLFRSSISDSAPGSKETQNPWALPKPVQKNHS